MIPKQFKKGFTLLELLVTLTVTIGVLAGTMAMFTKINQSVIDTNRNNDFTFQNRSLIDLMRQDFTRAGRGLNDFSVFNMNHQFQSAFAGTASEGRLYPIAELAYDDATKSSEIVLHYFDYDMSGVSSDNQTFFSILDSGDSGIFGDNMTYINMMSNDQAAIDALAEGDMVLLYRFDAMRQSKAFNNPDQNPWINQLIDGFRTNDAVVLEITALDPTEALGGNEDTVQYKRRVTFGEGNVFTNTIDNTNLETRFEDGLNNPTTAANDMATWLFETNSSRVPGLWQKGLFFARKLGNASSFHRVHYRVDTLNGVRSLLRIENGIEEVIAENVESFEVAIGVDAPRGMTPDAINNEDLDGYVTSADPTQWTRAYDDPANTWSVSEPLFNQIIGRHSAAAIVRMSQRVDYPDPRTGQITYKDRAFEHQFKLSLTRPTQYQMSNPYE